MHSDVAGHEDQRQALLRAALDKSPEYPAARWQLGQIRVQGAWRSVADAEQAARRDERLTEYARRRDAAALTVADQAALARWCRKSRLDDQQRAHWTLVLQLQPDNAEAIAALKLRSCFGILMTPAQAEQFKKQLREVKAAADRWRPLVAGWHSAVGRSATAIPAEVREKIAKIAEGPEMLALERELWHEAGGKGRAQLYHDMIVALMPLLGENPSPAAAASLARHAAFSDAADVRAAAIAGLKRHPLDHYVPLLLSGLQPPIEADLQFALGAGGELMARFSASREGALADASSSLLVSPVYAGGDPLPSMYGLPPVSVPVSISMNPGTGTVAPWALQQWRNDPVALGIMHEKAWLDQQVVSGKLTTAEALRREPGWWANGLLDGRWGIGFSTPPPDPRTLATDMPTLVKSLRREGNQLAKIETAAANATNLDAAVGAAADRLHNAQNARVQAAQQAAAVRDAVDRANRPIAKRNAQLQAVLSAATGQNPGERPLDWWAWWWRDYNGYDVGGGTDQAAADPPYKPESQSETYFQYPGNAPRYPTAGPPAPIRIPIGIGIGGPRYSPASCFAPGTKVWTLAGRQAIETIKIGDCVLAQDVDSGELAYTPVLAVTVRAPGPRLKIGLGGETIIATPGHPFWVLGQGWRMAKQLEAGNRVHTPSGGALMESVEKLPSDSAYAGMAYNLIVADFNSYFVGEQGVLVHDNTPRRPTAALVPGLAKRD
jgi:hypothetical protein